MSGELHVEPVLAEVEAWNDTRRRITAAFFDLDFAICIDPGVGGAPACLAPQAVCDHPAWQAVAQEVLGQ